MLRRMLRATLLAADRFLGLRKLIREGEALCQLDGDRAIEWSWVVVHLPKEPTTVLDVGCVQSALSCIAARLGYAVTGVDLRDIEYEMSGVEFRQGNMIDLDFGGRRFGAIINCSTIEHVGLAGRYGSGADPDGDLRAMRRLGALLEPRARMILTIPVGRDTVLAPYHRVYGRARLPVLLNGFQILKEEYWAKPDAKLWKKCSKAVALDTQGSAGYYALGLFVLQGAKEGVSESAI